MRIQGSKGGGSGSTPSESPDSLHSIAYAKVLDVISEGPIAGLANGLQSVFLDGTPIQNGDGSTNFSNYSVDVRTGTQDQTYLAGFPAVENETAVSTPLTSDTPWVHQIQNTQLTAVRIRFGVPALQKSDASTGNVTGYRVEYAIDLAVDGGSYAQVVSGAFDGKTTSLYERSVRIELPAATTSWLVRVRRITPNAHSSLIADTINIEAITEVIDRKLRYPMTALVGLSFDAQSFSSVPTRSYDINGLIIQIPSNFDPIARTYSGAWDGTFKTGWTDDPAWIFRDLLLNERYGLGKLVDDSMVDKWGLYQISQYCNVMVSDGKGGQEPRFTCNCVIQTQADAYKVLQDLATTFRGIAYWGPGSVVAAADMPADPAYVYTDANRCVSGPFTYVGSARKTRYTSALVSWNDPANQYKQAVEPVLDEDGIARYGVTKAQITAFGTTSQGQAHRLGQWMLLTSRYETNTISFSVGLDATLCAPGQIIAVADPAKAGKRIGGRIRSVAGIAITLDKAPAAAAGDTLTAILPSGVAQARTVSSISGDTVTVSAAYDADPVAGAVWMLESTDLASQLFRVVSVQEASDNDQTTYTINATQHEPGKYAAIDNGAQIQVRPITVVPPSIQPPPANVHLSTYSVIDQGISKTVMVIAWDAATSAVSYLPEWRKDNGEWVTVNATGGLQAEVVGIYQGTYSARVRAVNPMGVTSVPAYAADTALTGKTSPPPAITSLSTVTQLFAIEVDWTFPADGSAGDAQRTELWYSQTNDRSTAVKLSDYAYPQVRANLMGLAAGQSFFFWARIVDTTGNIGPWYPTGAGVNGQSSSDATPILGMLTNKITQTQLGQDVLAPIQAIPGIQQDVQTNAAAITSEQQARVSGDSALSTRLDQVSAQIVIPPMAGDTGGYAGATTVYAGVWSEQSARAEADLAQAQKVDTVTAQMQAAINGVSTTLSAAVQTETTARIAADSAQASQITTVQAQANANTAAVQTNAQSYADINGRVAASYQIKTQITTNGRTYIAGIGVGVDNTSGVVESQVLVSASTFAVLDPNGSAVSSPFVIQGGQTFINQAFIGAAWIQNANIGDIIQSTAVGANGQPRWKLDKNGTLTMNGANGGSGYLTLSDSTLLVYDNNGTLRVRLGLW
ncbi:MAG: phage tail protein [Rudaea sp.]|nr:phage tail protein [Rudaea sp.]